MKIAHNLNAPVKTHQSIVVQASPVRVWDLLTDINKWSDWQSDIKQAHLNGDLHPGTSFDWKLGVMGLHNTLHTVAPATELGWAGTTLGMYAVHNWMLTEVTGGTQVTVDETMQGWPASLLQAVLNPSVTKINRQWLERLKAEVEK